MVPSAALAGSVAPMISRYLAIAFSPSSTWTTTGAEVMKLTKECSQYTGGTPSFCTITESNLDLIPAGTKVLYYGPVTSSPLFTSSSAVLAIGPGNSAVGYCIVYDTASPPVGTCAFHAGSGTLAGFQGILKVTVDDKQVWHWDGGYLLAPPS